MPRPVAAIAMAVLLVAGCELEEETAEPITTTTVSEEAVAAAVQEIYADWTEQDCAEEAVWYHDFYTPYESDKHAAMLADIDAGRYLEAQSGYWDLWTLTNVALNDYNLWNEICVSKSAPALVTEVEAFPLSVEEARDGLLEICHDLQVRLLEEEFTTSDGELLLWDRCTPP